MNQNNSKDESESGSKDTESRQHDLVASFSDTRMNQENDRTVLESSMEDGSVSLSSNLEDAITGSSKSASPESYSVAALARAKQVIVARVMKNVYAMFEMTESRR